MVLDAFAPAAGEGAASLLESVGAALTDALNVGEHMVPAVHREALIEQTRNVCSFLNTLLRTARMTEPKRAFSLANQLVKNMPTTAVLYALEPAWKPAMLAYMTELVRALACTEADPQSLLSGLSAEVAKCFLAVVSDLDRPLCDLAIECEVWDFLTAVLENRQQWFAMYLLTGTLPRDRLKATTSSEAKGKPLLDYALDELAKIADVAPVRAKAMLHFVAVAQSIWVWATATVRSHAEFLKSTLAWLNEVQSPSRAGNNVDHEVSAHEHQAAAYMCDVLAVNLHAGLETGDKTLLKALSGAKLDFLTEHGVSVNAYNRSLHRNLTENLPSRIAGADLADFKRAPANAAPHGRLYYYDFEFAEQVLGHQPMAWEGSQGFAAEFLRANMNLSLVDAQVNLLASWKTLATTLSECVTVEEGLQDPLIVTVKACLSANAKANMDEPETADALQIRADMAFVILSRLVSAGCAKTGMKELLVREMHGSGDQRRREPGAWDLVKMSPVDYDVASAPEDLHYYRTLLQVLFLATRPHVYLPLTKPPRADAKPSLTVETAGVLIEIVAKTIIPGFGALCGNLHTDMALALPADFALLTALLQTVLNVKGIGIAHTAITEAVINSQLRPRRTELIQLVRPAGRSHGSRSRLR